MYQMPYTQHLQPIFGTVAPQMKSDTEGSLLQNEPSQGVFNHHPVPMGCYKYGYVPAYYNQPYPHYPPPPPFYYHGVYPSFPPMYPVHYPPPPYYPIDQPRFEFDKNHLASHRCCGCTGNQSNKTEDRHVRIERKEPNVENTTTKVPVEAISPLVGIPQGYTNTLEQKNSTESELKQSDQNPCGARIKENVKTSGKTNQDQTEGERNQFPFPFFWFPYNNSEEGKKYPKELDLSGAKGDNSMVDAKKNEGRAEIQSAPEEMKKKNSVTKLIPVKQGGENGVEKGKEIVKEKGDRENMLSENVAKSKFSPVCLRVEPLGRKKSGGTGKSRSPSPKRNGSNSSQSEKNEGKSAQNEMKAVDVADGENMINNKVDEKVEGSKDIKKHEGEKASVAEPELINILEKAENGETNIVEMETKQRKKLSDDEAAVVIQSSYRGFEVRRWDPLKKLKQIGEIREKVADIKGRINALEASFDGSSSDKERVVTGEMIMSLLLKLDTIQGLHPTVREIRKSVAKELVSLQDQLDSLGNKSSGISTEELETDPMGRQGLSEAGQVNEVCEESKNEVFEEAKEMSKAVSSTCELNNEEVKEEVTPSDCVNLKVENISSAEIVSEHQNDLQKHEMMATNSNVSEPEIGLVSETKVPSCTGEALIEQPSVLDEEFCVDKDNNEPISIEVPGADFKSPSTDVPATSEAIIAKDESQGYRCKEISLPENLEGKIKQEMGVEHDSVTEPEIGLVSETKVPSCTGEALTEQPSVLDEEFCVDKDNNEPISIEVPGADFKSPSTVVPATSEAIIAKDESQGYRCKEISLHENLEGEIKQEMGVEHDSVTENFQRSLDESLPEDLDDEIKREINTVSDDSCMGGTEKLLEETRFSTEDDYSGKQELRVQVQGYREGESLEADSVSTTRPGEPCSEPPLAENAVKRPKPGEFNKQQATKLEEIEFNKEQPTKLEEMEGCEKELDMGQFLGEQEASKLEEMKGSEMEPQMGLSEEYQESLENKYVVEVTSVETDRAMENEDLSPGNQDEIGSNQKLDAEKGSEVKLDMGLHMDSQDLSENKYVIKVTNVGNDKNMEPVGNMNLNQGKQVKTASDEKLEEENEKLREMVAKLVEAGKEQLGVISSLYNRVKDMEVKLQKKKKLKVRRIRTGSSCVKASEHSAKGTVKGVVV